MFKLLFLLLLACAKNTAVTTDTEVDLVDEIITGTVISEDTGSTVYGYLQPMIVVSAKEKKYAIWFCLII